MFPFLLLWGRGALAQDAPIPPPEESPSEEPDRDDVLRELERVLAEAPPPAAPAPPTSVGALNPAITAFGDLLVTGGTSGGDVLPETGPWLRSFEFDVRAPVDPFAKAVAVLAFEQEPPPDGGGFGAEPEEVYADLVALPAGFSARIGRFLLPFGIMGRMHPHDWPWPQAPAAWTSVVGEEGLGDTGAVVNWRVPAPGGLGATVQAGAVAGEAFDPEAEDPLPAWVGRGELFYDFGQVELGLGGSGHGLRAERVMGADLLLRWRRNAWRSAVLVAELFERPALATRTDFRRERWGAAATAQLQPTRPIYFGLRTDWTPDETRFAAFASGYTSEFLRLRGGVETESDLREWLGTAQLTFVWGAHPVEPYWVNR